MWPRRHHCFPPMEANVCNGAGILWSFSASRAGWNGEEGEPFIQWWRELHTLFGDQGHHQPGRSLSDQLSRVPERHTLQDLQETSPGRPSTAHQAMAPYAGQAVSADCSGELPNTMREPSPRKRQARSEISFARGRHVFIYRWF